jgi:hypothetical protein
MVSFVVTSKGLVIEPKVVSSPHPLFSKRATEAVSQWRFHPGRREGRLVNTRLPVPTMPNGEPPSAEARVLLLLALDETGRVQRAHILDAQPAELGGALRQIALDELFEPKIVTGEAMPSNVLLPFRGRR